MKFYQFPLSTYCQKTLMALYEKEAKFESNLVDISSPEKKAEYAKNHNRLGKVPYLKLEKDDWGIPESSIIIEYIDRHVKTGQRLIPDDPDLARQTRFRERVFDLYVNDSSVKIFLDGRRPEAQRDPFGVETAKARLDAVFSIMDERIGKTKGPWSMGEMFTVADCAAAPALALCRMVHPFTEHKNVVAYFGRLAERPSFQRVLKEAEPFMAQAMKG